MILFLFFFFRNWFLKLTKLPRGAVLAVCFPDKMAEGNALDENENINFDEQKKYHFNINGYCT
jgi:hypothetical protein